ncbi:MAG: hypothetical protein H0T54_10090 [Geodermatophilaceae bacterium]|nr:hypothetical protein [Geodermatophilaceae bacterium]
MVASGGATVQIPPITPGRCRGAAWLAYAQFQAHAAHLRLLGPYQRVFGKDLFRFTNVGHRDRVALIVLLGDELIAVGRYDGYRTAMRRRSPFWSRTPTKGGSGVSAVAPGSGRPEHGIGRFVAAVLAENRSATTFRRWR